VVLTERRSDPFADVSAATRDHRAEHGCGATTHNDGALPGAIAAAVGARRIVEVGTGLGYSALWLAHGAPGAAVDTLESDARHVALAREQLSRHAEGERVTVHHGDAVELLDGLEPGAYDLAFADGIAPVKELLDALRARLRPGGVLLCSHLNVGNDVAQELGDADRWLSHAWSGTALAVKR
jgi:predicted O-methyltransferase YrrM